MRQSGKGGSGKSCSAMLVGLCSILTCLGCVEYSKLMSLERLVDRGWRII